MAITRERKEELVQQYVELLDKSQAIVLLTSRGLTVTETDQLRARMRDQGASYHQVKNTLLKQALSETGMPAPELSGPVAVAFLGENVASTVKAIQDFGQSLGEREFAIVGGIMENRLLDAERARLLASLPSRETLFAQILAGIQTPAGRVTGVIAGGLRQLLGVLQARVDQLQEGNVPA